MKKTTIKDIAEKAGVSYVTVSKVVNSRGSISAATADRIRDIIKKTGYVPSFAAVNLVRGKTNTVAVIAPALAMGFAAEVLEGFQRQVNKSKYLMTILTTGAKGTGEKKAYDRVINGRIADVAVVLSNCPDDGTIKRFIKAGIPLILIESKRPEAFSVKVDNVKGAEKAVLYLGSKNKRKIGLIIGDTKHIESQKERMTGYKRALKKLGIPFRKEIVYGTRMHLYEDGVKSAGLFKKMNVDAVFSAAGDYVAYGLLKGIGKENISVIGYDDLETSEFIGLTTIRQPLFEMGKAAFEMTDALMGGGNDNPADRLFEPQLIVRNTV